LVIPVHHGVPNFHLTPWVRLWRSDNQNYWAQVGEETRLVLVRPPEPGEGWVLFLAGGEGELCKVCEMRDARDRDGNIFLQGRWGLAALVARLNPRGLSPQPVTLYWCASVPTPWAPAGLKDGSFDDGVESE
jgi:hypothetical protein